MQATVIHVFATFLIQIEEYIRKNWNAANDQTRILIQNKVCGFNQANAAPILLQLAFANRES